MAGSIVACSAATSGGGGAVDCRICGAKAKVVFSHTILAKYPCDYYFCGSCGFLQTQEPHWLDEAYASPIAAADTGLVRRNVELSKTLSSLLFFVVGRHGAYLDVAGGYGMLTRLMRDVGFDYYWSDKYTDNLFARGFEQDAGPASYSAVTAFEVLEHVPEPLHFVSDSLREAGTRTMVFSTTLFDGAPPEPGWWYYAFESGQHVSFFQVRTLAYMASRLGLHLHSHGSLHMLTDRMISPRVFRLLTDRRAQCLSAVPRRLLQARTDTDSLAATRCPS